MSLAAAEASGWRWEAGPGLPRSGGSAGSGGGGTLVAPVTSRVSLALAHRRASAGQVCVRRALCSSSAARDSKEGVERLWLLRVARLLPAGRSGSGVLEPAAVFTGGSRSRRRSPAAGIRRLRPGVLRARPPLREYPCPEPPLGLDWARRAGSVAPEPSGLGPFSFGRNRKFLGRGQPPVLGIAVQGRSTAVRIWGPGAVFLLLVVGPSRSHRSRPSPLKIAATSVHSVLCQNCFLALHVAKRT